MSVARWAGEAVTAEDIQRVAWRVTEQALANLGGLQRFVDKGATVWVKPNINFHRTPEFAANTNPDVVATVVRLCYEAGAGTVKVGDHSSFGSKTSYTMSGIEASVTAVGAEMVLLEPGTFKPYRIGGKVLDEWPLSPDIVESDLVVNVPVAKHHPLPKVSACMKNYMGVAGGKRDEWHKNIAECVCDITAFMKPRICVVDAIRVLTAGPPRGGNLDDVKFEGAVAAGVDPVALDAWSAEVVGFKPADIVTVTRGQARGLGQMDYRKLALREVTVS